MICVHPKLESDLIGCFLLKYTLGVRMNFYLKVFMSKSLYLQLFIKEPDIVYCGSYYTVYYYYSSNYYCSNTVLLYFINKHSKIRTLSGSDI